MLLAPSVVLPLAVALSPAALDPTTQDPASQNPASQDPASQDPAPTRPAIPPRAADVHWQGVAGKIDGTEHVLLLRPRAVFSLPGLGGMAKAEQEGIAAFVTGWLQQHPEAAMQPAHHFDGAPFTWVLVRDGDSNLLVDLVRAGWSDAPDALGSPGQLAELTVRERNALERAVEAAEAEALEKKVGRWNLPNMEGARQRRLGTLAFEARDFATALEHLDTARSMDQYDGLLEVQRARCLRELGREDEAEQADLQALEDAVGGGLYTFTLDQQARKRERREGADAAIAWLRGVRAWDNRLETTQVLLNGLIYHGKDEEATALARRALDRFLPLAGLSFDEQDRVLWDDVIAAPTPRRWHDYHDVFPLLELAALAFRRAKHEAAKRWHTRNDNIQRFGRRLDRSGFAPDPLPDDLLELPPAGLTAALTDPHPTARRRAVTELLRRAGAKELDRDALATAARAALDAQARREQYWIPQLGTLIETAWVEGVLDSSEQQRYLMQGFGVADGLTTVIPSFGPDQPARAQLVVRIQSRFSEPPTVAEPERRDVEMSAHLVIHSCHVDGEAVELKSTDDEPPNRPVMHEIFGIGRELVWTPTPGRHVVDLSGHVEITCVAKGSDAGAVRAAARVPVTVRAPMFAGR